MKEKLTLLDVCRLPEVQLHSKTSFFKSIINRESLQAQQMRENIAKLSYTIKTIGVQGEEVGITSKRLPLKMKQKKDYINNYHSSANQATNFIPHKSFLSQGLSTIKKPFQKEIKNIQNFQIRINAHPQSQYFPDRTNEKTQHKFRSQSMSRLRTTNSKFKRKTENLEDLGRIQNLRERNILLMKNKKSYSELLKECRKEQENKFLIGPLMHEENSLFKKIKKIKDKYPQIMQRQREKSSYKLNKYHSKQNSSSLFDKNIFNSK